MLGMSFKTMIKMFVVTAGVMFLANQAAAMNPMARKLLKGAVLTPVDAGSGKPGYPSVAKQRTLFA